MIVERSFPMYHEGCNYNYAQGLVIKNEWLNAPPTYRGIIANPEEIFTDIDGTLVIDEILPSKPDESYKQLRRSSSDIDKVEARIRMWARANGLEIRAEETTVQPSQ